MRRMRGRFSLGLLAVAALAVPAAAQAQTVTIRLTSLTALTRIRDTAPLRKLNKGDAQEFKDLLVNVVPQFGKAKGKPVAYDSGIITYEGAKKLQRIHGVINFTTIGTLTYAGPMRPAKNGNTVVRVTGGTGDFKGAHGTLTIGPGERKALNIYRVVVPNGHVQIGGGGPGGIA
jgi:hypothetical protein